MKKNLFVFLSLAAITAAASTAYGAYSQAGTGITGSKHDINRFATEQTESGLSITRDDQERVCAFCHSPHHAYVEGGTNVPASADYLPLWSHQLTKQTYEPYASDSLQATLTGSDPLYGPSRLCMSCHDGVIAIDSHYTNPAASVTGISQLSGDLFSSQASQSGAVGAGGSLAGDHPIGFNYVNARIADKAAGGALATGIREANSSYFRRMDGSNGTIKIEDVLFPDSAGGKTIMTCSSCHEVHNRDNVVQYRKDGTVMPVNYFLYSYQSGSQICLSCHDK